MYYHSYTLLDLGINSRHDSVWVWAQNEVCQLMMFELKALDKEITGVLWGKRQNLTSPFKGSVIK